MSFIGLQLSVPISLCRLCWQMANYSLLKSLVVLDINKYWAVQNYSWATCSPFIIKQFLGPCLKQPFQKEYCKIFRTVPQTDISKRHHQHVPQLKIREWRNIASTPSLLKRNGRFCYKRYWRTLPGKRIGKFESTIASCQKVVWGRAGVTRDIATGSRHSWRNKTEETRWGAVQLMIVIGNKTRVKHRASKVRAVRR